MAGARLPAPGSSTPQHRLRRRRQRVAGYRGRASIAPGRRPLHRACASSPRVRGVERPPSGRQHRPGDGQGSTWPRAGRGASTIRRGASWRGPAPKHEPAGFHLRALRCGGAALPGPAALPRMPARHDLPRTDTSRRLTARAEAPVTPVPRQHPRAPRCRSPSDAGGFAAHDHRRVARANGTRGHRALGERHRRGPRHPRP